MCWIQNYLHITLLLYSFSSLIYYFVFFWLIQFCQDIKFSLGIRHANHVAPFIRKSWHSLRRQAAVARSV
jgi:hypothetical protein